MKQNSMKHLSFISKNMKKPKSLSWSRSCVKMSDAIAAISSNFEHRLDQYSDLESIYQFYDNKYKKLRGALTQKIISNSPKAINSTDMKAFIDANEVVAEYVDTLLLIDSVRKKYEGLSKAFDVLNWQMSNLVKLQIAGLDGALVPV